jgi:hypothetical protein
VPPTRRGRDRELRRRPRRRRELIDDTISTPETPETPAPGSTGGTSRIDDIIRRIRERLPGGGGGANA